MKIHIFTLPKLLCLLALGTMLSSCKKHLDVSEWREQLLSTDENVRVAALADFPKCDVPPDEKKEIAIALSDSLKTSDQEILWRALDALPLVSEALEPSLRTQLVTIYLTHLAHSYPTVRGAAIRGTAGLHFSELTPFVENAMHDAEPSVRKAAIDALLALGDTSAPEILAVAANQDPNTEVATAAMEILKKNNWSTTVTINWPALASATPYLGQPANTPTYTPVPKAARQVRPIVNRELPPRFKVDPPPQTPPAVQLTPEQQIKADNFRRAFCVNGNCNSNAEAQAERERMFGKPYPYVPKYCNNRGECW